MLKFSKANAKTAALEVMPELHQYLYGNRKVYSLDLSSGYSCPGAKDCLSKAVPKSDGKFKIQDGPYCRFRCFSASQEAQYPATRNLRAHNFKLIRNSRGVKATRELILSSLPKNIGVLRYHVAGDFFRPSYLMAAVEAAKARPDVLFYAYTKSLHIIRDYAPMMCADLGLMLDNFLITASLGGKFDYLVNQLGIRTAQVVFSESEANTLGLQIDHDDSHAATPGGDFALLIHGTQPAGTEAADALKELKGKGSYSRKAAKA